MNKTRRAWFHSSAVVLILMLAFGIALPGPAWGAATPPADWQSFEHCGLTFSLPPGWDLTEDEGYGFRQGNFQSASSGTRAHFSVRLNYYGAKQADRSEELYLQIKDDGYPLSDLQIDSFATGMIGEWKAYRAVLTAHHNLFDEIVLYEAVVAIGENCVEFSMDCPIDAREEFEEMFARIVGSIGDPKGSSVHQLGNATPTDEPQQNLASAEVQATVEPADLIGTSIEATPVPAETGQLFSFSGSTDAKDDEPAPTATPEPVAETPVSIPRPAANTGDRLAIGSYMGEDIVWQVLTVKDGRALLLSEQIIDMRSYNEGWNDVTWETCTLRAWLNGDFCNTAFTEAERAWIEEVNVVNGDRSEYGVPGGNDTRDRIFLLSLTEVEAYFGDDERPGARVTEAYAEQQGWVMNYYKTYWLRSPGDSANSAAAVTDQDVVRETGYAAGYECGVRPAMWLIP